jgi:putative peptidoglycan lipid II flippase
VFKAAFTLFSGGLIGKLFGVMRELLLAALFGTTSVVGAFRISQTATLIPVNFFTTDSLNAGFIPLYSRYVRQDLVKAQTLFLSLAGVLTFLSVVIMGFLFGSAAWWVGILAPGFDKKAVHMAAGFIKVMALGVPVYVIGMLLSYLEMANGGYRLASLRASIQSIGLIMGTLAAFWLKQVVFLAWGFTAAYVVFVIWGGFLLIKQGILSWPEAWVKSEVRLVMKDFWHLLRPLLLLPFMLQGNIAVEKAVASLIGVSVVASLDYAKFIIETGIILLAVPLGLAGLSTMSGIAPSVVQERLHKIIPLILVVTVPVSVFIATHSQLVTQLIYQRGAFDTESVILTQKILLGLAVGFWAQTAGYFLIKVLNAQFRNREVVIFMALALSSNAIFNLALFKLLGPLSLGLGASLYGLVLFTLTVWSLRISDAVFPLILWLGLGIGLYVPISMWQIREGWTGFVIAAMIFVLFWVTYIWLIPSLRASVATLRTYLQRKSI